VLTSFEIYVFGGRRSPAESRPMKSRSRPLPAELDDFPEVAERGCWRPRDEDARLPRGAASTARRLAKSDRQAPGSGKQQMVGVAKPLRRRRLLADGAGRCLSHVCALRSAVGAIPSRPCCERLCLSRLMRTLFVTGFVLVDF